MITSVTNKSHICEHAHRHTNKYKYLIGPGHLGIKHEAGYSNKNNSFVYGVSVVEMRKLLQSDFWKLITEPFI